MSKAVAARPASPLSRLWYKWRFHINILLVIIPLAFMPKYFADVALFTGTSGLGERMIGDVAVGPWSIRLAEFRAGPPELDGPAGYMKSFNGALCAECASQVKATYLRIGKPRSLRAAGGIFFGTAHRMGATVPLPARTKPDAELWITMEGWDGSVYQAAVPLEQASPSTVAWLKKQQGGK